MSYALSSRQEDATNIFMFDTGKSSLSNNEAGIGENGYVFKDLFNLSSYKQQEYTLSEPSGNKVLSLGSRRETDTVENRSDAFYFGQAESEMENVSSATYPGSFDFSFGCNTPGLVLEKSPSVAFNLSFGDSSSSVSDDNPFKLF